MIRRSHLALLAALAVPPLGAVLGPQDPAGGEQDDGEEEGERGGQEGEGEVQLERDVFGRIRPLRSERHPMIGAWKLLDLAAEGYPEDGLQVDGYLLVAEGFLAFEMHASWDPVRTGGFEDGFQTFIAEYRLVGGSILSCRTLIGSWLDEEAEELQWEPPGFPREFLVETDGAFLTLRWDGGDRMTFGRRRPALRARDDIFGTPERVLPSKRGPDVFGREGERDGDDD